MFWLVWSSIVSSATSSIFDHCVGCELFGGWWEGDNGFWREGKTILLLLLTLCPVSAWPTFQQNYIVIITVFVVDNANLLKQKCQLKKKKTVFSSFESLLKDSNDPNRHACSSLSSGYNPFLCIEAILGMIHIGDHSLRYANVFIKMLDTTISVFA